MGAAGLALRRLQWVWRRSPRPIGQRRHGRRHGRSLRWQRDRVAGRSEGCILPTAGWVHHLERQWRAPSAQRRRERAGERGSANDEFARADRRSSWRTRRQWALVAASADRLLQGLQIVFVRNPANPSDLVRVHTPPITGSQFFRGLGEAPDATENPSPAF